MITTTLAKIRKHSPCQDGWKKLYKSLGGIKKYGENTPVKFSHIVESNDLDDALWCLRTICPKHDKEIRLFAADCAERVLHLYEAEYNDDRPRKAIQAARDFAEGRITDKERAAAWAAARDAARDAAWGAAWAAAWAATRVAARAATRAAARAATRAAAWAAARDAARDAAWDAAWAAEQKIQTEMLIERFS